MIIKFIFIFLHISAYFLGTFYYEGNQLVFFFFYASSCFYICYSCRGSFIFTEFFLSILLWLGFVFKFTLLNFNLTVLKESKPYLELTPNLLDKTLAIISIGFCLLIILSFLRERYIFDYKENKKKLYLNNDKVIKLYFDYEWLFLILFIFIVALFSFLNIKFNIFQKGVISNNEVSFMFLSIFKWLTMFGFASISSFIIFAYLKKRKSFYVSLFIGFIESLITSYGFLSRASAFFNSASLILGITKFQQLTRVYKLKKRKIFTILMIFFLFLTSILYFVQLKRTELLYDNKIIENSNNNKYLIDQKFEIKGKYLHEIVQYYSNKNKFIDDVTYLILYRWVGLDSMLAVVSNKNLSEEIFINSFFEKFDNTKYSYYERVFLNKEDYITHNENNYGILIPGFFSYSFYSGSLLFFLFLISLFYFFGVIIEIVSFKFSFGNYVFAALISQIYVYRLIHFGYMPQNSWQLILSILINIMMYFFICYIVEKLKK